MFYSSPRNSAPARRAQATSSILRFFSIAVTCIAVGCVDLPAPVVMEVDQGVPGDLPELPSEADASYVDAFDERIDFGETTDDMMIVDWDASRCGDGVVQFDEECDEGRATATCSEECLAIECGNGRVDLGEECDDGVGSLTCSDDCLASVCGNGRLDLGEECDDGEPSLVCDAQCQLLLCGNGVVDEGEECDDMGPSEICSQDCQLIICGNGRIDDGEACDDGNQNELDDCINNCSVAFPTLWMPTLGDPDLSLSEIESLQCMGRMPDHLEGTPPYEIVDGRRAFGLWSDDEELWIQVPASDNSTTRFSVDVFVPDGYRRFVEVFVTDQGAACGASDLGLSIRHKDRNHADNFPAVRVTATSSATGIEREWSSSGNPDAWVSFSILFDAASGYARLYYDDVLLLQTQQPSPNRVRNIRIRAGYEPNSQVRAPISLSNLLIEEALNAE